MIDPRTPEVLLLSLDSARVVRLAKRTSHWISGISSPSEREGAREHRFDRIVPWPPVPGAQTTIVWHAGQERVSGTRTGTTIAAWLHARCGTEWAARGTTVTMNGTTMADALTDQAAHALAVALNCDDVASPYPNVARRFSSDGPTLLAGTDVLARAADGDGALTIARRLNAHPAASVLASGLAVAADPEFKAYRIDPTWQMPHGTDPWSRRVERAALSVGAVLHMRGNPESWSWNGAYRHVRCAATWTGDRTTIRIGSRRLLDQPEQTDGPLTVLGLVIDSIDAIGDDNLLQLALNTRV